MDRHIHVLDGFLSDALALQLRGTFDERFAKPREGSADRFVWDWWHVPDQYTLMRTPAEEYFRPEASHSHCDCCQSVLRSCPSCAGFTESSPRGQSCCSPTWRSFSHTAPSRLRLLTLPHNHLLRTPLTTSRGLRR